LREIDVLIRLGSNDWHFDVSKRSEQAVRTEVNNIVNSVSKGDHVYCTTEELKALKAFGVLSHRAPHAMLVVPVLIITLLRHFGQEFKAVVFESILLNLTAESRQLRQTLLSLKNTIYRYNEAHNLQHDDATSARLLQNLLQSSVNKAPYPPPWQHHFGDSSVPVMDLKTLTLTTHALSHPLKVNESMWSSLSSPSEISDPALIATPLIPNSSLFLPQEPIAQYDWLNNPHLPTFANPDPELQKLFGGILEEHIKRQQMCLNQVLQPEASLDALKTNDCDVNSANDGTAVDENNYNHVDGQGHQINNNNQSTLIKSQLENTHTNQQQQQSLTNPIISHSILPTISCILREANSNDCLSGCVAGEALIKRSINKPYRMRR
jgi:hypothetical protein